MTRYENQTFENEHLILDEAIYINCKFKNCSMEYAGGDTHVQNCQGDECQMIWRGAAQRTVLLLQSIGALPIPTAPNPKGQGLVQ